MNKKNEYKKKFVTKRWTISATCISLPGWSHSSWILFVRFVFTHRCCTIYKYKIYIWYIFYYIACFKIVHIGLFKCRGLIARNFKPSCSSASPHRRDSADADPINADRYSSLPFRLSLCLSNFHYQIHIHIYSYTNV